jgi:predicted hotdog family 3-hydroxylacyl-ACP dehydratase
MLLLDRMVDAGEKNVTCEVRLRADSTFVRQGRMRAVVSLEYMAQCVAVFAGYRRYTKGEKPKMGYIVGARDVVLEIDAFEVGDQLLVHAEHVWVGEKAASFDCSVERGTQTIATATLSVYMPD